MPAQSSWFLFTVVSEALFYASLCCAEKLLSEQLWVGTAKAWEEMFPAGSSCVDQELVQHTLSQRLGY